MQPTKNTIITPEKPIQSGVREKGQEEIEIEINPNKKLFKIDKRISFCVDSHYQINNIVGQGSLGVVAFAKNNKTQQEVAIKLIMDLFRNPWEAKRQLRQIKILQFLKHKSIVSILDIMTVQNPQTYNDIYLVLEFIPFNLRQAIRSKKQKLSDDMKKFILFQILDGLNFMHSADIIHRDLKPENILVSKSLRIKITDMNLARKEQEDATKYVVSRPYRAPQLILSTNVYNKAIDIWSVGCIFAQLLGGAMLFASQNCHEQLKSFVAVLGKPQIQVFGNIDAIIKNDFEKLIKQMKDRPKINWRQLYEDVKDEKALDLLDKMLVYDPKQRYTTEQCLNHPYLQQYKKKYPLTKCDKVFDFSFDNLPAQASAMRQAIYGEIKLYHPEQNAQKRKRPTTQGDKQIQLQESIRKQRKKQ